MKSKGLDLNDIFESSSKDFSDSEKTLIEKAYTFSQKAHENQKRNNGEPYFNHAVEVAKNCASLGADAITISGALLHDTLEDTEATEEQILENFGEEVLFLVSGVTKLGKLKYQGVERHVESMRKFFIALAEDVRVLIIKLADRLHNIETLEHVRSDKQKRIAVETIEVYAPLAGRLGMGKLKGLLENLAFPFAYPNEYKETKGLMDELVPESLKLVDSIKNEVEEILKSFSIEASVEARVKHTYSLYRKLLKYNMEKEKIHDIVALRILVKTVADCYQVLGLMHMAWKPVPGRIKDWIAVPKPNGYKSLHTTVITPGGVVEIQIRTQEMHLDAELGIASHLVYKEVTTTDKIPQKQQRAWLTQLKELSSLVESIDDMNELKLDFFNHRIFVFTPKGDVVDLPEDSSPIDFAYAIHSDIGEKIGSVKINRKMASIDTILKNGDIVEIATNKNAHPTHKWLEHAKSSFAKRKIRHYLESNNDTNIGA
ncbi:bifunctional (p)ppGpp synthetase/guanosine-3',5'-bis(diphosphate) 3'-pyrophosphohydrolase [Candidatus Nomurabacteria bacterium]|nr:bifunctional (p)ppGpp synthetase/guanosine-3',5'-bis(diphosphate) 3'-pyrophosphohydrolase [Candidatus Nomurabacteria bacterium]